MVCISCTPALDDGFSRDIYVPVSPVRLIRVRIQGAFGGFQDLHHHYLLSGLFIHDTHFLVQKILALVHFLERAD